VDPFVESHRECWETLGALLARIDQGGLRALEADELEQFGRLYRQAATHLAQARMERRAPEVVDHLNLLVGRAHAVIYQRSRRRAFRPLRFLTVEFPPVFRRTFRYTGVSAAVLAGSALLAYCLVVGDPGWLDHLAPAGLADVIETFLEEEKPAGAYFTQAHGALGGGAFSALLWTHNLQIGLIAFALGIGLGIGTIWALSTNGLMVGSVLGVGALHGKALLVAAIMAPHGFIELSAVAVAGGAGLILGHAVLDPGGRRRRDALRLAAREAVQLALGTVPMFLVAGIIEGTISPLSEGFFASSGVRVLFGLGGGVLVWAYALAGDRIFARLQSLVGRPTPHYSSE
jgi:uncharacterized membrane protein SpoIIM required for sporulation